MQSLLRGGPAHRDREVLELASIVDVARAAEVSTATVTRTLRGDPGVLPKHRRRVLQAVEELGYVPNAAARGLRLAQSRTIGLIVPDLGNPAQQQMIETIEEAVAARDYSLLLCSSRFKPDVETANLVRLLERRVEGLIVQPVADTCPVLQRFDRAGVPVLVVGAHGSAFPLPRLVYDRQPGLRAGARYLFDLGHRRIAYVQHSLPEGLAGDEFRPIADDLAADRQQAMVLSALPGRQCQDTVTALLRAPNAPTALISGHHTLAPFVLGGIYAAGRSVPADVSFITMGDSAWAAVHRPPLTVAARRHLDFGRLAVEYIFARLEGRASGDYCQVFEAELVVRQSCAPPLSMETR